MTADAVITWGRDVTEKTGIANLRFQISEIRYRRRKKWVGGGED